MAQEVSRTIRTTVPDYGSHLSSDELVRLVQSSGSHFFEAETMRFFGSRLHDVRAVATGWLFITSEKRLSEPRRYSVRLLTIVDGSLTITQPDGESFQQYTSLQTARTGVKRLAQGAR